MLKSCAYCGRIHDTSHDCGRKPPKVYRRREEERGRYTQAWRDKSVEIKERSHYLCSVCLDEGALTYDGIETHHIIRLRDRPELLLEDSNLICLCRRHHEMAERGEISQDALRRLVKRRDTLPPTPSEG